MDRLSMWNINNDMIPDFLSREGFLGGRVSTPPRPQMKWKNAFGFVTEVRKKLGSRPRLYNQFIEIMRKVHNRSVQTSQVVSVISELFKGHPELIRGFNVFLPDGHKIEPGARMYRPGPVGVAPTATARIVRFTLNVKKRFEDDEKRPDKYKRFVEVLYLYKALSQQLRGARKCSRNLREEEVYEEVRKLFENNEDLLREFSEYLPYNKRLSDMYRVYGMADEPYNCSCCSDLNNRQEEPDFSVPTIDTSLILPDTPLSLNLNFIKAEPREMGELPSLSPSDIDFPDTSSVMGSLKSLGVQHPSNSMHDRKTPAVIVKQEIPTDFHSRFDDLEEDDSDLIKTEDDTQDSGSECGLTNFCKRLRQLSDF